MASPQCLVHMNPVTFISIAIIFVRYLGSYHHLLHLLAQRSTRDLLEVLETGQNLVLNLELYFHAVLGTLLDHEWLRLELVDSAGGSEVNDHVWASVDFDCEREDDAFARIAGVGDVFALAEAERCLPLLERFIVLVWC
jgi:hypothetical protein